MNLDKLNHSFFSFPTRKVELISIPLKAVIRCTNVDQKLLADYCYKRIGPEFSSAHLCSQYLSLGD